MSQIKLGSVSAAQNKSVRNEGGGEAASRGGMLRGMAAWSVGLWMSCASTVLATPFATEIVDFKGPFGGPAGGGLYDDPAVVLGKPATQFFDNFNSGGGPTRQRRVKIIEPAFNLDAEGGNKLIVTLNSTAAAGDSYIVARFDQPIFDNPANPYGIDLLVFGNAFYVGGGGFVNEATNMNTFNLTTGIFAENVKVSVSPDGIDWYRYDAGPYGDTAFPTQGYKWDRAAASWTDEEMDFTKPVNPAMNARFAQGGLTAADGIDLYTGSGGGTGFDLAESGFQWIQYVKVEGIPGFAGGEIDAFSTVRPMVIGDDLSISPVNIAQNTATLFFQNPDDAHEPLLAIEFTQVSDIARVTTSFLDDLSAFDPFEGDVLHALLIDIGKILGEGEPTFAANLSLHVGNDYIGNGDDLSLLHWSGESWESPAFTFDAAAHMIVAEGVTSFSPFVLTQAAAASVPEPAAVLLLSIGGFALLRRRRRAA